MDIRIEEIKWVVKDLNKMLEDIENEDTRETIQSTIDDLEVELEKLEDKLKEYADDTDWDLYRDCLLEQQEQK